MNKEKLKTHVKLCIKNLKSKRVKCCANCPWEDDIIKEYPELKELFIIKKSLLMTNPYLRNSKDLKEDIKRITEASSQIEH